MKHDKHKRVSIHEQIRELADGWLCKQCGTGYTNNNKPYLYSELPKKWQQHGDLVLFPDYAFSSEHWSKLPQQFWSELAALLKARRLGVMGKTKSNDYREPTVRLLLGEDGWSIHTDNHVRYCFDVTQTMFSSGNITEKLRVSKFDCSGQTIVDLYAGIGYYTLQYLVHTEAKHVHACEWNPHAVTALKRGLELNKVTERCTVHAGDNSQAELVAIADRINLGLLPSSQTGWHVACKALKAIGGYLHIHDCLNTKDQDRKTAEQNYTQNTVRTIRRLLTEYKPHKDWTVTALHLERVKSYAPHITHVVLDIHCRPTPTSNC